MVMQIDVEIVYHLVSRSSDICPVREKANKDIESKQTPPLIQTWSIQHGGQLRARLLSCDIMWLHFA